MKKFLLLALVLSASVNNAFAQNFSGRYICPTNGVLTVTQSGNQIFASMAGNSNEWWGKNKGGSAQGAINGNVARLNARDGVGNVAVWTMTFAANGNSFNGTYRVTQGPIKGVSGAWSGSRPAAPALVWRETESGVAGTFYGTWTWDATRKQFSARWNNGAIANITIVRDDGTNVVLRRMDPSGASATMTAEYVGRRQGNTIRGTMTLYYRGGKSTGTWSASW